MKKAICLMAALSVAFLHSGEHIERDPLTGAETRWVFPPGVEWDDANGRWNGWYDITKWYRKSDGEGARHYAWVEALFPGRIVEDGGFCWAMSGANMVAWWLDVYRARGGAFSPKGEDRLFLEGQSRSGHPTPVIDALVLHWSEGGGKVDQFWSWFFEGTYQAFSGDTFAQLLEPDTGGYVQRAVPVDVAATLTSHWENLGFSEQAFHGDGTTPEAVRRNLSRILLEWLKRGPLSIRVDAVHELTLWGVKCKRTNAGDWGVSHFYVTDSDLHQNLLECYELGVHATSRLGPGVPYLVAYKSAGLMIRFSPLVGWEPPPPEDVIVTPEGEKNPIKVPKTWLWTHGLEETPEALLGLAANGRPVWACYVAGLDPRDPKSDLRITIAFDEDGTPLIDYAPKVLEGRVYRLEGKRSLADASWEEIHAQNKKGFHFFRVAVEMDTQQNM